MIDNGLIIDAVVHGFDVSTGNRAERCPLEQYQGFQTFLHSLAHVPLESLDPGFILELEEFVPAVSAESLAHTLFVESDIDIAFYHHVPIAGFFKDGVSPLAPGLAMRELAPNRVYIYGGVDTFVSDPQLVFEQMERHAERGAVGFKFYPSNGVVDPDTRALVTMLYDDPERAYPYFEKARELGITHLAFHKAFPMGPSVKAVDPADLLAASVAFPDLTFEIVHAGIAFLDETALELMVAPNIYANLELSGNLIVRQPRRFAEILGLLLQRAGADRIVFGSGCAASHPDPVIEAFKRFEMPKDLVEGYGYPEVTDEMKQAILGGNMARMHGIDIPATRELIAGDSWAKMRAEGKRPPWELRRKEAANLPM